jgi:SSS family solute:Na+ symporter
MGRWTTVVGVLISVGTAYLVMQFASIMDYLRALFSFFNAPLFGTVVLGMLWKRATRSGGFWGLLSGTLCSVGIWTWVKVDPSALRYVALSTHAKGLAQDMGQALWSFITCVGVTVYKFGDKTDSRQSIGGLVYGLMEVPSVGNLSLYQKPLFWAGGGGERLCGTQYYFLVAD